MPTTIDNIERSAPRLFGAVESVAADALPFQAGTDQVWPVLARAIDDMDGARGDSENESELHVEFSTGVTLTGWGEQMTATVVSTGDGSEVQVRGQPTGTS